MKKFFGVLFVLGAVLFASCDQIVDLGVVNNINNANNNTGSNAESVGYGSVSVVIGSPSVPVLHSAMPTEDSDDSKNFTDIYLYGNENGAAYPLTEYAYWSKSDALANPTIARNIPAGTNWTFKLEAKRFGTVFSQTKTGVTVAADSTTKLEFNSLKVDVDRKDKGAIEATIKVFKKDVGDGTVTNIFFAAKIDDGEIVVDETKILQPSSYTLYTFTAKNVEAGTHLITFYIYKANLSTNPVSPGELLMEVPYYENVIAGYTSRMTEIVEFESVKKPTDTEKKKIIYKANYPSGFGGSGLPSADVEREFYKGDAFLDAEALGFAYYDFGGLRFAYWTTDKEGTGTKYNAGAAIDFDKFGAETTLYAQWKIFSRITYRTNPPDSPSGKLVWDDKGCPENHFIGDKLKAITDFKITSNGIEITPSKLNYLFCGWDTEPNGTGTRYEPNTTRNSSGDITLYAQWCYVSTSGSPKTYMPYSARELNAIIGAPLSIVNGLEAKISIARNLSVSGVKMISSEKVFNGEFTATGTTISGLTAPLFKGIGASGKVINLTVDSSNINGAGAIAETNAGRIENCVVKANVTVTGKASDTNVGGMVGENTGTITGGTVSATVIGNANEANVGGVVGKNTGTITGGTASATVTGGANAWRVAGVAGYNTGTIENPTVTGSTTNSGDKAYYNDVAVGINGDVKGTVTGTATHNGTGKSNVYQVGNTTTPNFKGTEQARDYISLPAKSNKYVYVDTPSRPSKISLAVRTDDKNEGAVIFYRGKSTDNTEPKYNSKKETFGTDALKYNWKGMHNTAFEWNNDSQSLSASSNGYTLRIYNTKNGDTPFTYRIILE